MPFIAPITIKAALERIDKKEYLLPAIQREFVWDTFKIEKLFDSLMRDYPIGSFLFWEIGENNINDCQFYEFVRDYDEQNGTHNREADIREANKITAVLDGQQRLTALYLGLKGTYAYKEKYRRRNDGGAFPKRCLFVNLIAYSADEDFEYNFKFLTPEEAKNNKDDKSLWFEVGDILKYKEQHELNKYIFGNKIPTKFGEEKAEIANRIIFKLFNVIHEMQVITAFLEEGGDLDKALNIFIRTNSGGTELSYSDLLLSTVIAQWKNIDARKQIHLFVDDINGIGEGFNINKDIILKSCLVLADLPDIAFKVKNFNPGNIHKIEKKWNAIKDAMSSAVKLVDSFGFSGSSMTSKYPLISIAGYLSKIGNPQNFIESDKHLVDRKKILRWLLMVLLKRTFTNQPDNVIRQIREIINLSPPNSGFPIYEIIDKFKGTTKAISFDKDSIDNILESQYKDNYTHSSLSFIYPTLDFRNKFHKDHIFPKAFFTKAALIKRGIEEDKIDFYLDNFNRMANLQFLEGITNQEKSKTDFNEWLMNKYPDASDRKVYMERHYIPDIDLRFENFEAFITERKKLIVTKYKELLNEKLA